MTTSHDSLASPLAEPERRLDPRTIRREFPALRQLIHGHPLAYLDNAATTHKPVRVLDALIRHYERDNANVHRSVHTLGARATEAYERARARVARFLGARDDAEIVFTRGTTEALNLVAESWGRAHLREGDVVVVTALEHHANFLPWRRLCDETGARLRVVPIDAEGTLCLDAYDRLLEERPRLVAVAHASNALGSLMPIASMIRDAHAVGAVVVIDGALAAAHAPVDVATLDCDFYACSAHKMYGPTGIGALYGKAELLATMPPWQTGGDMVLAVDEHTVRYAAPPHRFEAGTPAVAGAIAFAAALDWLTDVGPSRVFAHEHGLLTRALDALGATEGVHVVDAPRHRVGAVSFAVDGLHPHDVATVLDEAGVAARAGDQCAQPLMRALGLPGTVRLSVAAYNTEDEIDRLAAGVEHARTLLR